jgi:hypothetical protein
MAALACSAVWSKAMAYDCTWGFVRQFFEDALPLQTVPSQFMVGPTIFTSPLSRLRQQRNRKIYRGTCFHQPKQAESLISSMRCT